jgi:hypothetical protein
MNLQICGRSPRAQHETGPWSSVQQHLTGGMRLDAEKNQTVRPRECPLRDRMERDQPPTDAELPGLSRKSLQSSFKFKVHPVEIPGQT